MGKESMNISRFLKGLGSRPIHNSSFMIHNSPAGVRGAFTIVELLMVIGVIGILMGIVTTAAMGSLKSARSQRASALCSIVEQGLATYYAQNDKWPEPLGTKIANGSLGSRSNTEGWNNQSDDSIYILDNSEAQQMIRNIVEVSAKGNPMLDIAGLFVSRDSGEANGRGYGTDLFEAVRGTKRNPERMSLSQMNFGYPDPNTGYFRHFKIVYSIPTDEMKVSQQ